MAPYLEPEIQIYPGAYQPVITYPLEENLAQYRDEGIPKVPVDSLTE